MERTLALGFLMAATTPLILVYSTAIAANNRERVVDNRYTNMNHTVVNSSCATPRLSSNCFSATVVTKKSEIHSNLWLPDVANSLLADSVLFLCGQGVPSKGNYVQKILRRDEKEINQFLSSSQKLVPISLSSEINSSLSALSRLANQRCVFSWQKRLHQESPNLKPIPASRFISLHDPQNNFLPSKFPQLSRSSLIVSFPQQNTSFIPKNTKLANPAPETKRIASPFGWRKRPYSNRLQFHQGIDYGAPYGSPVVAVGNGIVTRVVSGCADFGNLFCGGQLGNWIEVDHGNSRIGTYGHLKSSSITVKEGMKVWKNQNMAQVGSSGWSTGAHLDFRLKVDGKYEDPARHVVAIEPKKIRLK